MRGTWPLVGRREELALVAEALNHPEVHGVVLAGEAGVGKSRLARECLELARAAGFHAEWTVGTQSSSTIPFGAMAHLLPEDLLSPGVGPSGQARNLIAVAEGALAARSGAAPLIVGVDDAHLLDDFSAALLHHLTVTRSAFVATVVRSGEPVPDAVARLWKDELAERVDVQSLSQDEAADLVESALGDQVDGATLHWLWDVARGNPLFLREVVLAGLEAEVLTQDEGVWRWKGEFRPPPRLSEVIEGRLAGLEREELDALEVVAAADHLGASILAALAPRPAIEAVERRGLIEAWNDDRRTRVRLSHPLYGEVIRSRTPLLRAQVILRQLADALETAGARRREDLLRLASWRLEGGGPVRPDLMVTAARHAGAAFDFILAERLAQRAVEVGGGFAASHALAEALIGQGRFEDGESLLEATQAGSEVERAQVAVARAMNLFLHMGDESRAEAILREAERALTDPMLRVEVAVGRVTFLMLGGKIREAVELSRALLAGSDVADRVIVEVGMAAVWPLVVAGHLDEALALIERALEPAARMADEIPQGDWWLRADGYGADLFAGRLHEAEAGMEALYRESAERGGDWRQGKWAWALGWIARTQGRVTTSLRWLREAVACLREVDMMAVHLPWALADLAHTAALIGDVSTAEEALAESRRVHSAPYGIAQVPVMLARAWTAAARGEVSAGASLILEAAGVAESLGQGMFQAFALYDASRLGEARTAAPALVALAQEIDGRLVRGFAAHAAALASRDGDALSQASVDFEEMGAHLYAAEAAAAAASIHRDAGRIGSALAASRRAKRLAGLCEGASTPALGAAELRVGLTRREREIGTLAASGHSNRDIAARLVISIRTVENHLHAAYAKLGVTGRDELAPILAPERQSGAGQQI